jgi:predicted DsbA family dithiol-disulfide isomerase
MRIDVWSDVVCPWCYVGKRRLDAALAGFAERDAVSVSWRAFELDPSAPRVRDPSISYAQRLARKYGKSLAEAEAMVQRMTEVGAADGLDFHFERARSGNTFDAHRVLQMAAERGRQEAVGERLFRGYFTDGEAIGEADVLARLAAEAGLDAAEVRAMLDGDAWKDGVRADETEAADLGIHGVPFFLIDGKYAISGAEAAPVLLGALERALAEEPESESTSTLP